MDHMDLKRWTLGLLLAMLAVVVPAHAQPQPALLDSADNGLLVLSYHDIRDDVATTSDLDAYAVSTQNFAAHLDWLSAHGYHPVSLSQLITASQGGAPLPPKPVLLTFDDGLRSVYSKVFPLLRAYNYPALVAVITDYVDMPAGRQIDYGYRPFTRDDFLTWEQLREMQKSGLIELASHTDNLHHGVQSNPQGNSTPAVITRIYDPTAKRYETAAEYDARLRADLQLSVDRIRKNVGVSPKAIVWPYAAYNALSNDIAEQLGMPVSFDLEGRSTPVTRDLHGLARLLVTNNPTVVQLAYELRRDVERRQPGAAGQEPGCADRAGQEDRPHPRVPAGLRRPGRQRLGRRAVLPQPAPADARGPVQPGGVATQDTRRGEGVRMAPGAGL